MQVLLKNNIAKSWGASNYNNALKRIQGTWVNIDTQYLFNNQYNTVEENLRIYDTHIEAVRSDARINKGKCKYCGKMVNRGEECNKYPECSIEWFTPENTFFLKYPNGLKSIPHEPEYRMYKERTNSTECIKIGSYYLENFETWRFSNCRKKINFKYDGKFFYIYDGIGIAQVKRLDVPATVHDKLVKILNKFMEV